MRKAEREGTLVLVENLDPSYASSEVEVFAILYIFPLPISSNVKLYQKVKAYALLC